MKMMPHPVHIELEARRVLAVQNTINDPERVDAAIRVVRRNDLARAENARMKLSEWREGK